ncbi:NUDIX hydrolase [Henriciella mobilis]|uniref:NAD regulator n=1 Tax=Henriciella mobilis TaxID=2305467 RepID=A0A399R9E1_9PROT|nr:NAD regulator [Henriciella mobilis]RIJ14889.1 NAD regulator [Henriciella mobilis]RIJ21844.1 NAD regulator [Henriciella mobilis]RIJ26655.1 NAD regulator [Henriciella mobilis]
MTTALIIGLSVVIVAADGETPCVLVTRRDGGLAGLPFGTFDPARHRTFELALRGWVREQTGFDLGYVEQLYTFGDRDRETPEATLADAPANARVVSVGYLGLTPDPTKPPEALDARWRGWYSLFPWEDHRNGRPAIIDEVIAPRLSTWAAGNEPRQLRANLAFGLDGQDWIDDRVLERYELLYEAGLVTECARDAGLPLPDVKLGEPMASDHRRILATAMGRLRGKIRYRPVIFELMPERFTLSALQMTCEGILGLKLHKQNFRRALDRTDLVEGTGEMMDRTGGRPAELYRFRREKLRRSAALGITTPAIRRDS